MMVWWWRIAAGSCWLMEAMLAECVWKQRSQIWTHQTRAVISTGLMSKPLPPGRDKSLHFPRLWWGNSQGHFCGFYSEVLLICDTWGWWWQDELIPSCKGGSCSSFPGPVLTWASFIRAPEGWQEGAYGLLTVGVCVCLCMLSLSQVIISR